MARVSIKFQLPEAVETHFQAANECKSEYICIRCSEALSKLISLDSNEYEIDRKKKFKKNLK